jgi:hypothetical protein
MIKVGLTGNKGGHIPLKDVDGKLRVSTTPYLYDISKGNIPGHYSINKFGYNPTLPTSYEDVWEQSLVYTYTTTAQVMHCSSSSGADTQMIEVQGLDENWQIQIVTVKLVGQTETAIGTALWKRIFRVKNLGTTDFAGTVYVYEDDTVSSGVPQTPAKIRAIAIGVNNQTQMALFTIPAGHVGYITGIYASTSSTKLVSSGLFIREYGGVFQIKHLKEFTQGVWDKNFPIPLKVKGMSDIAMKAKVTVAGGDIAAGFDLWYEEE